MMDFRGHFVNASKDWKTGEWHITFSCIDETVLAEIDRIKEADLDISADKHRERRGHDANAYAWVLMQKIAELVGTDKWSIYIDMLKKYSRSFTHMIVKPEAVDMVKRMYRATVDLGEVCVNGKTGRELQVYFGSSTFDTKEMSVFIDGIVSECKMMGIRTETPDEIEHMKAVWDAKQERRQKWREEGVK